MNSMRAHHPIHLTFFLIMACIVLAGPASADTLQTTEYRVTASSAYETTPTLGNDGTTDLVVFTVKPLVGGVPAAGDIWYQPLSNGAPVGMPVQVTSSAADEQLNDVSGDYIVYTAYDSVSSTTGAIVVHQISTGDTHTLGRADIIQEPRIHGTTVVWREGGAFATMVMRFKLAWIGTGMAADILAGPVPPTFEIQIGARYAVWSEYESGQYDVYAYDLDDEMERRVTNTAGVDERAPATSGMWIVWEQTVHGATTSTIEGHNQLTHAMPTIADNGALNLNPSIDGDIVAWESNVAGNLDIWVHRISTGDSFQVTTEAHDQYLNDLFGETVAYVDMRRGTEDVWVTKMEFIPPAGTVELQFSGFNVIEAYEGTEGTETATLAGTVSPGDPVSGSLTYDSATGQLVSLTININDVITYSGPPFGASTNVYVVNDDPHDAFEAVTSHGHPLDTLTLPPGVTNSLNWLQAGISLFDNEGTLYSGTDLPTSLSLADFDWGRVHLWTWFPDLDGNGIANTAWRIMADFRPNNIPPIANAGPDQAVHAGNLVTLDGSGSSDPDGNYPLIYAWKIASAPMGSTAALSDPSAVNPSFTADRTGEYTLGLIVTDSFGLRSASDTVLVSTANTPPTADAGPDQAVIVLGSTIQLDGSQSWDPDGDLIYYTWAMTSKPGNSAAAISNPSSATPTFVADVQGTYVAQLVVDDNWAASAPDTVTVSFENVKPVADAGGNQAVRVGDMVLLNGSGSSDVNRDPLTYSWSFVLLPAESAATLSGADTAYASFIADAAGTYVVGLVVNDGFVNSDPANATIVATSLQSELNTLLRKAVYTINHLIDPASLKNRNMAHALTNKLNAVLEMIDQGRYQDALDKLENDILKKTDGCATSGAPDKNDWIENCENQNLLYGPIMEAIGILRGM